MSVRKRKDTGRWQARYTGADGKVHAKDFDLKSQAQRWEREQMRAVERGDWVNPSQTRSTLGDLAQSWLDSRQDIKETTRRHYGSVYERHVAPRWARMRVSQITPQDVQDWIVGLTRSDGQPMGASQKRQAHQVLAMILDHALRAGSLNRNPARFDAVGKVQYLPKLRVRGDHRYLTGPELHAIARHCGPYRPLILLLGTTGLRWGEATALTVGDVDWLRRRISVTKAHAEIDGEVQVGTPKTHECRTVPVTSSALELLSREAQGKDPSALLVIAPHGGPLRNANFHNRVWGPARKAWGDDSLRIHDLRHTAASLAVASGANVKAIQQMLGHASAQMTLDRYAGLFDSHLDDVADRMELLVQVEESDSEVTGVKDPQTQARPLFTKPHVSKGKKVVAPRGFEPPTQGLGNLCSIP